MRRLIFLDGEHPTRRIKGIAFSGHRFRRLWDDVTTGAPELATAADDETAAGQV